MIENANTTTGVSSPYVYNALGQLIETNLNTVGIRLFWYDEAGHYLGVYNSSGGLGDETVWLGDIPVATIVPSGHSFVFYYIHTDHLNTPRQATLPGNNSQMYTWFSDPFGTTAQNQNPQGNGTFNYPPRFPGQVSTTQVAGLYQNGFRDYDPQTGRYIESDPIGLGAGINTYQYALSNSLLNVDPTGLISLRDLFNTRGNVNASQCGPDREKQCDKQYYDVDIPTCRGIARQRGADAGRRCYTTAANRYAACLRGDPIPDLDTHNWRIDLNPGPLLQPNSTPLQIPWWILVPIIIILIPVGT